MSKLMSWTYSNDAVVSILQLNVPKVTYKANTQKAIVAIVHFLNNYTSNDLACVALSCNCSFWYSSADILVSQITCNDHK
jgi:hypothetical protein